MSHKLVSYAFPGIIDPRVTAAGAGQVPYMRTPAFSALVKDLERRLLDMAGCRDGHALFLTSSGTGAMDAVVSAYGGSLGKAYVLDGGSFGHRWADMCRYYGIPVETFDVDFFRAPDYDALERGLAASGAGVFLVQQHETSSGVLYDMGRIAAMCRRRGVRLVVDAISSFLSEPLDMDALGIDLCLTSSQKGLNLYPGLSVVFVSSSLEGFRFGRHSYYFDFDRALTNLVRGQTPWSPATMLFLQMKARLDLIDEGGGVAANIERVRRRALHFRSLCRRHGWEMPAENPANCLTGFIAPGDSDKRLANALLERGIAIMPGSREAFYRVSHLGDQTLDDLDRLAEEISSLL